MGIYNVVAPAGAFAASQNKVKTVKLAESDAIRMLGLPGLVNWWSANAFAGSDPSAYDRKSDVVMETYPTTPAAAVGTWLNKPALGFQGDTDAERPVLRAPASVGIVAPSTLVFVGVPQNVAGTYAIGSWQSNSGTESAPVRTGKTYYIDNYSGQGCLHVNNSSALEAISTLRFAWDGTPHVFAVSFDGTNYGFAIDGSKESVAATSPTNVAADEFFLFSGIGGGARFRGFFYDLMMFDVDLLSATYANAYKVLADRMIDRYGIT